MDCTAANYNNRPVCVEWEYEYCFNNSVQYCLHIWTIWRKLSFLGSALNNYNCYFCSMQYLQYNVFYLFLFFIESILKILKQIFLQNFLYKISLQNFGGFFLPKFKYLVISVLSNLYKTNIFSQMSFIDECLLKQEVLWDASPSGSSDVQHGSSARHKCLLWITVTCKGVI